MINRQSNQLHLQRGRLLERIASQRAALARESAPLQLALSRADALVLSAQRGVNAIKQHPYVTGVLLAALFMSRASSPLLRWTRRGFFVWQTWRGLRDKLRHTSRHTAR